MNNSWSMSDDFICSRQREETTSRISYRRQAEQGTFDEGPYRDTGKATLESSGSRRREGTKPTLHGRKCETRTVPTATPTSAIQSPRVYTQPACAQHSVPAPRHCWSPAGFPLAPRPHLHPKSTRNAEHPRPQTRHRFLCCSALVFHV